MPEGSTDMNHFPPVFLLRAWAPDPGVKRVWIWDRLAWSTNESANRGTAAQRGTVKYSGLQNVCSAIGDRQLNARWNEALETDAARAVAALRQIEPKIVSRICVRPVNQPPAEVDALRHLLFSAPVRVEGHPPAWQTPAAARRYLEQLEDTERRRALEAGFISSYPLHVVWLDRSLGRSLAITDWGAFLLSTSGGYLLLLPISPWVALCAADHRLSAEGLERFFDKLDLPGLSEAQFGTVVCVLSRRGEDLRLPEQKDLLIERLRESMERLRPYISLGLHLPGTP